MPNMSDICCVYMHAVHYNVLFALGALKVGQCEMTTVVQEVEKSVSNQKVASSNPCRSVFEQGTEPLIAPDVQCKICIHFKSHICKSLWIKASAKCKITR